MTHKFAAILYGAGAVALASTAMATAPAPAPGNAAKGKTVFARCAACHKVDASVAGGIGPNLAGVYGRTAGTKAGYTYSPAMKASKLKWTDANIDKLIAGPAKAVPGTKMMAPPVANPQDRADVIAYLKTLK